MSQREKIVNALVERGIVVDPDVLEHIIERGGMDYLSEFIEKYGTKGFVSLDILNSKTEERKDVGVGEVEIWGEKVVAVEKKRREEEKKPAEKSDMRRPEAYEHDWNLQVLIDPNSLLSVEGKVEDFVSLFQDRFRRLSTLLRRRPQFHSAVDIKDMEDGRVAVIGMVSDKRNTSTGKVMFTLEDFTGVIRCLYSGNDFILNDEVIGITGTYNSSRNIIYVDEITHPGIYPTGRDRRIKEPVSVAIISDIHIGSKTFLKGRWERFLEWLKSGKDGAEGIKYLIVAGDLVDGIGVYPNQERELEISDIFKQYEILAGYINELPDYIKVIIIPGNHDIVRVAEPQPPLPDEITKMFNGNAIFLSNPTAVSIHGYRFLIYHGGSLNNIVELVPGMSYDNIGEAMKILIESRHLSPVYGEKVPLAPLPRDFLVVDTQPDVFITGHVHTFAYAKYKGIHLVNASTWQAQTLYQKMMNFNPDPGKVAILNLHTDRMTYREF